MGERTVYDRRLQSGGMTHVVVFLKGCPTASLGPYGNERIATPALDALAAGGVVFDAHFATHPEPAGVLAFRPPPGRPSAVVRHSRPVNDSPPDFYAGWGRLFDARPDPADKTPLDALLRVLPEAVAAAGGGLLWIECDRLTPPWDVPADVFEAYIEDVLEDDEEYGEPIRPWADPPAGWFDADDLASWELLHRTLAAAVTTFDADLGKLFGRLREAAPNATVVLTADYGHPLGEHGVIGRFRPHLHEELVHLPLVVRFPDGAEAGRRVQGLTEPADLAAWLSDGGGIGPLLRGESEAGRLHVVSRLPGEVAVRTPDWAYLKPLSVPDGDDPRGPMLFRKPADRCEVLDVSGEHAAVVEEMEAGLARSASEEDFPPR